MSLRPGLIQKQIGRLAITPQLSQAIELLQYSAPELSQFLEEKALENPLIEVKTRDDFEISWSRGSGKSSQFSQDQDWLTQIQARDNISIQADLLEQLNFKKLTSKEITNFGKLINYLDEAGFLKTKSEILCKQLGLSQAELKEAVKLLQSLEPAGLGARDIKECLVLQIKALEKRLRDKTNKVHIDINSSLRIRREDLELARVIIKNHFEEFANRDWRGIAKELQTNLQAVQKVFDFIKTLKMKPYEGESLPSEPDYLYPDLIVEARGEELTVSLVNDQIPEISFNDNYASNLQGYQNSEVNDFIAEKRAEFHWIMKSLQQRQDTLAKLGQAVVELQREFFLRDQGQLLPMTMQQVADLLQVHESTVSRAVRGKYVQTNFGSYELRSLFTSSLPGDAGEMSSASVKEKIANIVDKEDKRKPLSDQKIVTVLKNEFDISVSRRTIAKYRGELNILSSTKRKRF